MSNANGGDRLAKLLEKYGEDVECLIMGLFKTQTRTFYDGEKISSTELDAFYKDEDVQRSVLRFVADLDKHWTKIFPKNQPLRNIITSSSVSQPKNTLTQMLDTPMQPTQNTGAAPEQIVTPQSNDAHQASPPPSLKPAEIPAVAVAPKVVLSVLPTFQLPNCKVGISYNEKVTVLAAHQFDHIVILEMRIPQKLGLVFNSETQCVTGDPLVSGDFELDLIWRYATGTEGWFSGKCKLIANPDPRTLWKVIEPDESLPYRKAHTDSKLIKTDAFSIVAASRRGRSHEHGGSFRDDDFFISHDATSGWSVLVVADGAGSAKNSREGSRIAVECAGGYLHHELLGVLGAEVSHGLVQWEEQTVRAKIFESFYYAYHKMAGLVIQQIEHEARSQSLSAKDYATTLLVAAVKKMGNQTFLATFWIGDGAIAACETAGTIKLMGSPDGGEFAGQTRFVDHSILADQGFHKRISVGYLPNISAIALMTDGVSDPYFETDSGLQDSAKWNALLSELKTTLNCEEVELQLIEWLHFFKPGHHDDRTLVVLWGQNNAVR